jgi:opacity protein-like surface antigen
MNMKNFTLCAFSLLILTAPAFAGHGIERVLPEDAKNVAISSVSIGYDVSSQTLISDGNDGPVYQNNYSPVLSVEITYDSKDTRDDATALNEDDQEEVVGGPTLTFYLPVTDAQVAAIKAHTLDGKTLVAISVAQAPVQFTNPVYTDSCIFSSDYNEPVNPECIQNVVSTEVRPVLNIDLK